MNKFDDSFHGQGGEKKSFALYLVLFFPVVFFGFYIWHYAINVPYVDDAELVSTINEMKDYPSQFFTKIVRQQNDQRVVFPKIGAIMSYLITGYTDFRVLTFSGEANRSYCPLLVALQMGIDFYDC